MTVLVIMVVLHGAPVHKTVVIRGHGHLNLSYCLYYAVQLRKNLKGEIINIGCPYQEHIVE